MDWQTFLIWLHIATVQYCNKQESANKSDCVAQIKECVLDGEDLKWCKNNWK